MLACGHVAPAVSIPVCAHLQVRHERPLSYLRWYVGRGSAMELLCQSCTKDREAGGTPPLGPVCQRCYDDAIGEVELAGVRGRLEIAERPKAIDTTIVESPFPAGIGAVVDLAPIEREPRSAWLAMTENGTIALFDADSGNWLPAAQCQVPPEPDHEPWADHPLRRRLHASRDGNHAAVVNDYGHHGEVIDLRSGRRTMLLDGGDYRPETVPFSFAFTEHNGRTVAIHRTAWNRLDASDASTGALLTARGPTSFEDGKKQPEHYLDYFHGALLISPDGRHVVDDGWVWHPVGIPHVWSVSAWLGGNLWESEDGPTLTGLCMRDYYWDQAQTWLDGSRVVIGGLGADSDHMPDGARVFDIGRSVTRELIAFPGPSGTFFGDARRLYSADAGGTQIWDPIDGARTAVIADFVPTHHHRAARELVQITDSVLRRWVTGTD